MNKITWVGFDADDTLWDTETHYINAKDRFAKLLSGCVPVKEAWARLDEIETSNVQIYGYGVKSFALSMIEAAVKIARDCITHEMMEQILQITKEMLQPDTTLSPETMTVLKRLEKKYRLLLITKGELLEQSMKIKRSGIEKYFQGIEIVYDKTLHVYQAILQQYGIQPDEFVMVGNSLRSDILPVVEAGGWAIYVPHPLTWSHESNPGKVMPDGMWYEVRNLTELPQVLDYIKGLSCYRSNETTLGLNE
jgi:putative hydrolase of the HAD superfamily